MVPISLLEFLKTGSFGPLKDRRGREGIVQLLGPPDDFGGNPTDEEPAYVLQSDGDMEYRPATKERNPNHAAIWFYGDFEIHFNSRTEEAVAWMICTDHFHRGALAGGGRLALDPWVFEKGLRLERFLPLLEEQNIKPMSQDYLSDREMLKVMLPSGVGVLFATDVRPPDWEIHSLFRVWDKPLPEPVPPTWH